MSGTAPQILPLDIKAVQVLETVGESLVRFLQLNVCPRLPQQLV